MSIFSESLRAFLKPVVGLLDDESVTEIMINGPSDVWVERKGRLSKTDARFTEEGLLAAARNMAQFVGRPLSDERPRLDARLPDGSRIHVVLPPIARAGASITIRKFFKQRPVLGDLLRFGSLSEPMARLIEALIALKVNVIVSGGTGSGKTTLLNVLSALLPNEERILTLEDSAELQLSQEHWVSLESRPPDKFGKGEVGLGDLLHSALRMRPDRIVVGEVRGGEAFHLIQAMNTGHGGSLTTCHANTPTDTLRRLESLCLMSAMEMPLVAVRAQVASAAHVVVCCERLQDGSRKVTAISEVLPLNERGDYRTQDLFVYVPVGRTGDGSTLGFHGPTGILPTFLPKLHALGLDDIDENFFDPEHYGLPAPPVGARGEAVAIHWAPSLKHRDAGGADGPEIEAAWTSFVTRLKGGVAEPARVRPPRPVLRPQPVESSGSLAGSRAPSAMPSPKIQATAGGRDRTLTSPVVEAIPAPAVTPVSEFPDEEVNLETTNIAPAPVFPPSPVRAAPERRAPAQPVPEALGETVTPTFDDLPAVAGRPEVSSIELSPELQVDIEASRLEVDLTPPRPPPRPVGKPTLKHPGKLKP